MIAPKPMRLSYVEAASVPVVASTAWQMVFDHGHLDGPEDAYTCMVPLAMSVRCSPTRETRRSRSDCHRVHTRCRVCPYPSC